MDKVAERVRRFATRVGASPPQRTHLNTNVFPAGHGAYPVGVPKRKPEHASLIGVRVPSMCSFAIAVDTAQAPRDHHARWKTRPQQTARPRVRAIPAESIRACADHRGEIVGGPPTRPSNNRRQGTAGHEDRAGSLIQTWRLSDSGVIAATPARVTIQFSTRGAGRDVSGCLGHGPLAGGKVPAASALTAGTVHDLEGLGCFSCRATLTIHFARPYPAVVLVTLRRRASRETRTGTAPAECHRSRSPARNQSCRPNAASHSTSLTIGPREHADVRDHR
jgi:hypothetical protein